MNEKKNLSPPLAESKSKKRQILRTANPYIWTYSQMQIPIRRALPSLPFPPPFFFPYSVEGAEGKTGGDGSKVN